MIDVIKWEFYKKLQEFKLFYLILIGIAIIDLAMPANVKDYDHLVGIVSSVFSGITFFMIGIYLIVSLVNDLRRPYNVIEKLIYKRPWEVIGGKLISNALQIGILYVLVYSISMILKKFSTESTTYLTINLKPSMLISIGVVLPLFILFYYLLSLKLKLTKNIPIFSTVCFIVLTSTVISSMVSRFPFNDILWSIIGIVIFISIFFISCILYEKVYEIS